MLKWRYSVVAAAAIIGSAIALSSAVEAKSCVLAGGEGTGVTADIATFMANAALKQSIDKMGAKASGKAKVSCKTDMMLITTCKSQQRACK